MKPPVSAWIACGMAVLLAAASAAPAGAAGAVGAAKPSPTAQVTPSPPPQPGSSCQPKHTRTGLGPERIYAEAAAVLGISKADLMKELNAGKSLTDVAAAKGKSREQLLAGLNRRAAVLLDKEVKNGTLTREAADRMKEQMNRRLPWLVDVKGVAFSGRDRGRHGMPPGLLASRLPELAADLGMSREELQRSLASGKSLAEIAASKGVSREQLIAKLKDELTPVLEKLIDHRTVAPAPSPSDAAPKRK